MKLKKIQIVMFSILAVLVTMLFASLIIDVGQMTTLEKLNLFEGADIEPDEEFFRIVYKVDYNPSTQYLGLFLHWNQDTTYTTKPVSWNWLVKNGYIENGVFHITHSMIMHDLKRHGLYRYFLDMEVDVYLEGYY